MTRLGELGLSGYEERAYRALLSLGHAPAGEVATASGVPTGRIYDVLNGLAARGVVGVRETEPRTYEAVRPEVAVEHLLAERREELDARAERYETIAAEVTGDLAATTPSESRFWAAPLGSDAAIGLVGELFDTATTEIVSTMSVPYGRAAWDRYATEMESFVEHVDPALEVRTLITPAVLETAPAPARQEVVDGLADVAVRVTSELPVSVDLVDEERACLHVPHPTDPADRFGIIEVRDADLVADLAGVVADAWAAGTPLDEALDGATGSSAT